MYINGIMYFSISFMVVLEVEGLKCDAKEFKPAELANFCGGTLINNRYVVTAGHCTAKDGPGINQLRVTARIGDWNLPNKDSHHLLLPSDKQDCKGNLCSPKVLEIRVSEYHRHRRFNAYGHHDICLMRLSRTVQFNDFVRPICLPLTCYLQEKDLECYDLTIAGWGFQQDRNRFPNTLQKLRMEVTSNSNCQKKYLGDKTILESQICAGTVPGESTCRGDSGGPLMLDVTVRNVTTYYLMGVDSFGFPCDRQAEGPHVSTKVTSYVRWILDNIKP